MRKGFMIVFFLGFFTILLNLNACADENTPVVSSGENESISRKLDKVMDTQTQILKELDEMKAELQIVKIRASEK